MGSASSTTKGDNGPTKEFIQTEISSNDVVIFSKSYCPYCKQTKSTFASASVTPKVFELDIMPNGSAIQDTLQSMTGQRSVPNVFIKGTHLGGNDDTQAAAASGKLAEMLGKVSS